MAAKVEIDWCHSKDATCPYAGGNPCGVVEYLRVYNKDHKKRTDQAEKRTYVSQLAQREPQQLYDLCHGTLFSR